MERGNLIHEQLDIRSSDQAKASINPYKRLAAVSVSLHRKQILAVKMQI